MAAPISEDSLESDRESCLRSSITVYFGEERKVLMPGIIKDPELSDKAKNMYVSSRKCTLLCLTFNNSLHPALNLRKKAMELDVRIFVNQYFELLTTGRSVARIFHGLGSPKFPASEWSRNKQWNAYSFINFIEIAKHAQNEIALVRKRRTTGN